MNLIFDKDFRIKYAPNNLLVLFADTGNEHPFTYDYIKRVIEPLCAKHNIEFVKITNDKVDKVTGKSLVFDTEITKLVGVEAEATKNQTDLYLLFLLIYHRNGG